MGQISTQILIDCSLTVAGNGELDQLVATATASA